MKKLLMIISLVFLLCIAFGCQDKAAMAELEEFRAQAALEEENKALVMRYFEAWGSVNFEAIKEIFSPDYVWHRTDGRDLSLEQTMQVITKQNEQAKVAFPDMTFINDDTIVKGDKAVLRYTFRGTHEGEVEGIPATGNVVEVKGIEIVRIENGKIAESWEVVNILRYMEQIGYELKLKEGEK